MLLAILAALPTVLGAEQCPSMRDGAIAPALACFVDRTPACPDRQHCFGLHLHVVNGGGGPVQNAEWFAGQLEHVFVLFEPVDVGFQVVAVDSVDESYTRVETREQRDAIGRSKFSPGVVHVFVVGQLDDVDVIGEQIRGVHWRQRSNTDKRWLILSAIAPPTVLAHELGHFFGLPHSSYRRSIMNKTPRDDPPWSERVFVDEELAIVRAQRDVMGLSKLEPAKRAKAWPTREVEALPTAGEEDP